MSDKLSVMGTTYLGKLLPLCSSWPSSTGSASFFASSAAGAAAASPSTAGVSVAVVASVAKSGWLVTSVDGLV